MFGAEKILYPRSAKLLFKRTVSVLALFLFLVNTTSAQTSYPINTCSGSLFSFTQPGALNGTTYTWTAPSVLPTGAITGASAQNTPQSSISQVLVNVTNVSATATYTITPSGGGLPFQLVVTVNPLPVLSSTKTPAAICSNTNFIYPAASATLFPSFSWSRQTVAGISNAGNQGTGNANEILVNTTTNPIVVHYAYNVTGPTGCTTYGEDVAVTVNPTPIMTSTLEPSPICGGTFFDYTATSPNANGYSWTRLLSAGINNGTVTSGNSSTIHEALINTSPTRIPEIATYVFTLNNSSQSCASNQQVVKVYVYPVPTISNQPTITSCSGNTFMSFPLNTVPGTTYGWTTPTGSGSITGGTAAPNGQLFIGQALVNNAVTNQTIQYQVTPTAYGCTGTPFTVDVTVTPNQSASKAVLSNSTPQGICSGGSFSFPILSNTGVSYTWQRFYNNSINQAPSNGSGALPATLTDAALTNNTTLATTAYYAITLTTADGCKNTETVALSVNPPTVLNTSLSPAAICSNTVFNYPAGSNTTGTVFSWTRAAVAGISNAGASGTGNPLETLINITNTAKTVRYVYSLITPNGCANIQNVDVAVNPVPSLTSPKNPNAICSATQFNYPQSSNVAGTSYSWTRDILPNITNGPGAGNNNPAELLVNSSTIPVSVPYNYTLSANGCSNSEVVTVLVNPTPVVFNQAVDVCSNTAFTITPANTPSGTLYTWGLPVTTPANSISGISAEVLGKPGITQLLTSATLNQASALYTISPISGTCVGASFVLSATVNPVPIINNQQLAAVCSGTAFTYTPVNVPVGTTYTWSSPVQAPFNSLTGGGAQPLSQPTISQTLTSSNNLSDTATYSVTPSASGCIGNVFTVTVPVKPVPVINNIIDTICTGRAFSISPTPVPVNTTYTWTTPVPFPFGSIVGGAAQGIASSTISQVLVNATAAPAQIVYTVTPSAGNCAGNPFTITEVVGNALAAFPNTTAVICSETSFDVTPATAPPNTTYTWGIPTVRPAGSVVGVSARTTPQKTVGQTLTNITINADTVVYTILPANTGCKGNTFTATIRVLPLPTATIIAPPAICRYPFDTLTIHFTGTAPWSFTYSDSIITRTQTGITTPTYQYVVPSTGTVARRTLSVSPVQDFACVNTDTSFLVQRINPLPVGQINSLHGIYICKNTIDTLFVSSSDSLGYQWTYYGNPIPGITSDSIATLTPGSYNAVLTNRFGCTDTAAAPISLSVVAEPVVRFVYDAYCINTNIRFTNLTDSSNIGPTQWVWDFGDSTGANTYNSTHTYIRGGDHHVRLTALQQYCPAYITSADSILNIQYPIPAIRMPSVSAYKTQLTPLSARPLAGYRYQWTPTRGLDTPDNMNTNFNYQATQEYLINLISTGGCITKDTMLVRLFEDKLVDIFVPKSFTPNSDGVNDILYPYLTGIKTFQYFKVYNRFGKLMFETTNPDAGWNGQSGGIQQPMAIYIWISVGIANDGSKIERKGETLLLR